VIVNSSASKDRITLEQMSDATRIRYAENLTGAPDDGIVDAEGNLAAACRSVRGKCGRQLP
jgi:hypothetical protein